MAQLLGANSWEGGRREPQRVPRAEVERRLLATAVRLIEEHGLTVSLEHLRVDELMEITGVPKTSFYRVWASKEEFLIRILEEVVRPDERGGAAFDMGTLRAAIEAIQARPDLIEDEEGRKRLFYEAIRVGAERNYLALRDGVKWKTYTAVQATLRGLPPGQMHQRVEQALVTAETAFVQAMVSFYTFLLPLLGRRFRTGAEPRHLAAAGAAVVEGLVQRSLVNAELAESRLPGPALDGGTTDWHIAAIGFLGVTEALLKPDSDWSADKARPIVEQLVALKDADDEQFLRKITELALAA